MTFAHKPGFLYSWNYLDQLICGYYEALFDSLKYSSVRFVLAPLQSGEEEAKVVQSFLAFTKSLTTRDDKQVQLTIQIVRNSQRTMCQCISLMYLFILK